MSQTAPVAPARLSAPDELSALVARLRALHVARHPIGLGPGAARVLELALRSGQPAGPALRAAGIPPRLAAVVERGGVLDVVALLGRLVPTLGEVAADRARLASAALTPIWLGACVLTCALVHGAWAWPALGVLARSGGAPLPSPAWPGDALFVFALVGLVACAAASVSELVRLPWLVQSRTALARHVVLATVTVLHEQGVPLSACFDAAAEWLTGAQRSAAERIAECLRSGAPRLEASPLLDDLSAELLRCAAGRGVAQPVLCGLVEYTRGEARRALETDLARVAALSFLAAGVAVGWLGARFVIAFATAAVGSRT